MFRRRAEQQQEEEEEDDEEGLACGLVVLCLLLPQTFSTFCFCYRVHCVGLLFHVACVLCLFKCACLRACVLACVRSKIFGKLTRTMYVCTLSMYVCMCTVRAWPY